MLVHANLAPPPVSFCANEEAPSDPFWSGSASVNGFVQFLWLTYIINTISRSASRLRQYTDMEYHSL